MNEPPFLPDLELLAPCIDCRVAEVADHVIDAALQIRERTTSDAQQAVMHIYLAGYSTGLFLKAAAGPLHLCERHQARRESVRE